MVQENHKKTRVLEKRSRHTALSLTFNLLLVQKQVCRLIFYILISLHGTLRTHTLCRIKNLLSDTDMLRSNL